MLLNELLKGAISLSIAFRNAVAGTSNAAGRSYAKLEGGEDDHYRKGVANGNTWDLERVQAGGRKLLSEVFRYVLPSLRPPVACMKWSKADSGGYSHSRDCWKLSIPACLYVIQNNVRSLTRKFRNGDRRS